MKKITKLYKDSINTINDSDKTLINVVSSGNIDRESDIIIPDLIDDGNYSKSPVVLFQHNSNNVIGKSLWRKVDGNNYISKTQFANTRLAKEIFSLYKDGFMTSFSIGFIPIETPSYNSETNIRTFGKIEILEYSAVSIPANPNAVTLSFIKGLESPELTDEYLKNYVIENIENELVELKSSILTLKEFNCTQENIINELNGKYDELQKEINEILFDSQTQKSNEKQKEFIKEVQLKINQKLNI